VVVRARPGGEHMQNRYRRLPLVAMILFWGVGGAAELAQALTFTEFPVATAGSLPGSITAGPDGALWFTEVATKRQQDWTHHHRGSAYRLPNPYGQ
jgi:streptogramin lyase